MKAKIATFPPLVTVAMQVLLVNVTVFFTGTLVGRLIGVALR